MGEGGYHTLPAALAQITSVLVPIPITEKKAARGGGEKQKGPKGQGDGGGAKTSKGEKEKRIKRARERRGKGGRNGSREWRWGGAPEGWRRREDGGMEAKRFLFQYLFVRRNMLLSRKSGIEKLESAVHRDSDIIPQGGHGGKPGGCVCCWSTFSAHAGAKSGGGEVCGELSLLKKKGSWSGGGRERDRGSAGKDSERRGRREGVVLNEFQCVPERTLKVSLLCIWAWSTSTHMGCVQIPAKCGCLQMHHVLLPWTHFTQIHVKRYIYFLCKCSFLCMFECTLSMYP